MGFERFKDEHEDISKRFDKFIEVVTYRDKARMIFERFATPEERVNYLLYTFNLFEEIYPQDMLAEAKNKVLGLKSVTEESQFVTEVSAIVEPMEQKKYLDAYTFRVMKNDYIDINELISCVFDYDSFEFHISPNEGRTAGELLVLFRSGMRKLAEIVKNDERIKFIRGVSWILNKNPGLAEKLGFTILHRRTKDYVRKDGEVYRLSVALMSRETLLEKWGS